MIRRFIHLSDIHFGQERHRRPEHEDAREELLRDCRRMIDEGQVNGAATGILLSGDTAFSGKEAEFKAAARWLERLAGIAGCDLKHALQVIPGNHDVDLSALSETGQQMQVHLRSRGVDDIQGYLNRAAGERPHPLLGKLADYRSFAGAYGSDFDNEAHPICIKTHTLEGGPDLRIVGLCSVTISDRSDARGNMFLGQHQYVLQRSADHIDVVMVHHPLHWFKDEAQARSYLHGRPRVLMTAHEHLPELIIYENAEGFRQLRLAAGAVNPPETGGEYTFRYNWLEFAWTHEDGRLLLSITIHPRRWSSRGTRFDADREYAGGAASKTVKIDCGKLAQEMAPATPAEPAIASIVAKAVAMPESNTVPPEAPDKSGYEALRFIFWRYLERGVRQQVLAELNLLRPSPQPLPTAFEREAFELASREGKLADLWDATMAQLEPAERRPNPFLVDKGR